MSTEQEIISYKPDLNIYGKSSEINGDDYAFADNDIKYSNDTKGNKSRSLRLFESYSPKTAINSFLETTEYINKELNEIKENCNTNKYESDYFSAKTKEDMQAVLDKNNMDIDYGSSLLEIYGVLESIYDHINEILDLYVKCIFGDNVDPENADEIINEYVGKLEILEANYEYEKVNYASLYYDTLVSYVLEDFISVVDHICEELTSIDTNGKNFDLDKTTSDLLNKYFNKEAGNLNSLNSKLSDCKDNVLIALKNFYLEKQDFLSYLNTFAKIYSYESGKSELSEIKSDCQNTMKNRFDNLVKSYMNYNLTGGDVLTSVNNKVNYRSFFK